MDSLTVSSSDGGRGSDRAEANRVTGGVNNSPDPNTAQCNVPASVRMVVGPRLGCRVNK